MGSAQSAEPVGYVCVFVHVVVVLEGFLATWSCHLEGLHGPAMQEAVVASHF